MLLRPFGILLLFIFVLHAPYGFCQNDDDKVELMPAPIPGQYDDNDQPIENTEEDIPDETLSDQAASAPTPEPTHTVFKHFRFDDGVEYTPGPAPTPPVDIIKELDAGIERFKEAGKDMPDLEKELKDALVPPTLQKCTENTTESIEAPDEFPEGAEGQNSPMMDMLFLDEKDVPEDYEKIFGAATLLVPFAPEAPNIGWSLIDQLSVECLPYRVRMQGRKVYFDQGMNALKNYSKGPKGEFHPYIQSRYGVKK